MKKFLLIAFSILLLNLQYSFTQTQGNWYSVGPTEMDTIGSNGYNGIGRTVGVAVSQADTNNVYVIDATAWSERGDLWKSTDDGNTWNLLLNDAPGPFAYIKADPVDVNVLYGVVGDSLYKSTDAGSTWLTLNVGFDITYFDVKLLIDPLNNQVLYLSGWGAGLRKSIDGGGSWNLLTPIYFRDIELNPLNSNVLFGTGGNKVFRSENGGISFDSSSVIPMVDGVKAIAVTEADTNYVYVMSYASNNTGHIAVSSNRADTFTVQPIATNMWGFSSMGDFEVSAVDAYTIIFGGVSCTKTSDTGMTWSFSAVPNYPSGPLSQMHVDQRFLLSVGSSKWFANDGGIYKTEDDGITWINKSKGLNIAVFNSLASSPTDSNVYLGGNWDNAIFKHDANGWLNAFSGDGFAVAINPQDPLNIFGANQYGNYSQSFDGGLTTVPCLVGGNGGLIRFNPQNTNSLFILRGWDIWKSTDKGATVTQLTSVGDLTGYFFYVCDIDSNIFFTRDKRSVDGGVNWISTTKFIAAVDPDEPNKVWGYNDPNNPNLPLGNYFSSDTGNTWTQYAVGSAVMNTLEVANNIYNGVYALGQGGPYYIDDRLSNLQAVGFGLPMDLKAINVLPNFGMLRGATFGRGVWQGQLYDASQPLSVDFTANRYSICPSDTIQFYDNSLNNGPGFSPTYSWTFPGGSPSTSNIANPVVYYGSAGKYDVTLAVSNTNGIDTIIKSLFIDVNVPPLVSVPFVEGFETPNTFPPPNWDVNHYRMISRNFSSGIYGAYTNDITTRNMNYYTPPTLGYTTDFMLTPTFDFPINSDPKMRYDFCYALDSLAPDTFKIFYSTDCGVTKNYLYQNEGWNMMTTFHDGPGSFWPDSSQWITDTLDINAVAGLGEVQFGFEVFGEDKVSLFLDNINLEYGPGSTVDVSEMQGSKGVLIYPNPVTEEMTIQSEIDIYRVSITDISGRQIHSFIFESEFIRIDYLLNGIYFLKLETEKGLVTKKFIKQ